MKKATFFFQNKLILMTISDAREYQVKEGKSFFIGMNLPTPFVIASDRTDVTRTEEAHALNSLWISFRLSSK